MNLVLGIASGLVWGALASLINLQINKKAVAKKDPNALLAANLGRMFVDLAALAVVFLLRKQLPFSYEGMLVGTAISLSLMTLIFAFRIAGKQKGGKTK